MKRLRCAVYARFSSDRQSPTSIEDQIRKCREHAAREGWDVLEQHIYTDEAVGGGSTDRDGLQRLLTAATHPSRPFDCILIDDTSRLNRKLADALNLYERLTFAGLRLVAVSQGVDSSNAQAELLIGVHGLIDGIYWRELGMKTHRGMQGLALRGKHTGGRCFGYRSVKDADGGARLEVDEIEAAIVRRIFTLYAEAGYSLKKIAHLLNAEGVLAPQPRKGRMQSWCLSSVRHVLLNRRYTGKIVWNTRRKVRVPQTNKRVFRARPESEWVIVDAPELRIVSDEMFAAVTRRFERVKRLYGRPGEEHRGIQASPRRYLFSGLLKCAVCGGSITLVCGRGQHGADRYGCSIHHQRGDSECTNALLVRRDDLERDLLRGLSESVLRTEVVDYVLARLQDELHKDHERLDSWRKGLGAEKNRIEGELKRLVDMIAGGNGSTTIMEAITAREARLKEILNTLVEPGPGSLQEKLDSLREFAVSRLAKIRELLSDPEAISKAHEELAERIGSITLEPKDGIYIARGSVDFFGEEVNAHSVGAGGQNRTGYACLFRAALYQ